MEAPVDDPTSTLVGRVVAVDHRRLREASRPAPLGAGEQLGMALRPNDVCVPQDAPHPGLVPIDGLAGPQLGEHGMGIARIEGTVEEPGTHGRNAIDTSASVVVFVRCSAESVRG
jgi:hypothetical protein